MVGGVENALMRAPIAIMLVVMSVCLRLRGFLLVSGGKARRSTNERNLDVFAFVERRFA